MPFQFVSDCWVWRGGKTIETSHSRASKKSHRAKNEGKQRRTCHNTLFRFKSNRLPPVSSLLALQRLWLVGAGGYKSRLKLRISGGDRFMAPSIPFYPNQRQTQDVWGNDDWLWSATFLPSFFSMLQLWLCFIECYFHCSSSFHPLHRLAVVCSFVSTVLCNYRSACLCRCGSCVPFSLSLHFCHFSLCKSSLNYCLLSVFPHFPLHFGQCGSFAELKYHAKVLLLFFGSYQCIFLYFQSSPYANILFSKLLPSLCNVGGWSVAPHLHNTYRRPHVFAFATNHPTNPTKARS